MDWNAVRAEFPSLARWTYLNTATFGQLPRRAVAAANRHFDHRDELAASDFLAWFDDVDGLRAKLARLFGGAAQDYAFFSAAAPVLSLLIHGIDWRPGDRVVTLENEFPNQVYFPALLAERGVEFIEAPHDGLLAAVDSGRTRLVVISAMSYSHGFTPELEQTARELRQRNVLFFVDGTQGAGALKYDLAAIDPDVFAVHAYKWMLAPTGAAFAYFSPRVRQWLEPNVIGWRSHHDWRNVNSLHHGKPAFSPDAERYEGAMLSAALLYMLEASVDLMLELGADAIQTRVLHLAAQLRAIAERLGGRVAAPLSPIAAIRFEGRDAAQIAAELKKERILVSARHGNLRVSPHFYNHEEDLAHFERVLTRILFV